MNLAQISSSGLPPSAHDRALFQRSRQIVETVVADLSAADAVAVIETAKQLVRAATRQIFDPANPAPDYMAWVKRMGGDQEAALPSGLTRTSELRQRQATAETGAAADRSPLPDPERETASTNDPDRDKALSAAADSVLLTLAHHHAALAAWRALQSE